MSRDRLAPLVPGDDTEARVRERYHGWATGGLAVVRELAERTIRGAEWPRRPGVTGPAVTPALRELLDGDAARARSEGWLVSPPAERAGHAGRLQGLGLAVKDVIDVAGLPTRNGAEGVPARVPAVHATAWAALEAHGARCVGKAATHAWAWGVTTPSIANPVDPDRIAGGSSGGSAATVRGGAAHAGLGTDTGGSIRIPAALCGVVGIRPTCGRIDMRGITPLAPEQDVVGPLAADVTTAAAVLEVLLGRPCMPSEGAVRGLRIGHLLRTGGLDDQVDQDYTETLRDLESQGADLVPLETDLPRLAVSLSLLTMLTSSARLYAEQVHAAPSAFGPESRALLTLGADLLDTAVLERARRALEASTAELFGSHDLDVVLTPTTPCVAPPRGAEHVTVGSRDEHVDAALTRFTAWAAATGLPAIAVPTGRGRLPTSMQVMAAPDREDTCIRVAQSIEQRRPTLTRGNEE
ncbi:amidase [Nocardioides aquiterrae]|uniref:Amidase n=1 Tax=Nocardioides aquiterrae TaxID=203799 RepID=A0ABN1UC31_9ACTN